MGTRQARPSSENRYRYQEGQAAAEQYNLLADKANRRIDMIMRLGAPKLSDKDRLERIEVS